MMTRQCGKGPGHIWLSIRSAKRSIQAKRHREANRIRSRTSIYNRQSTHRTKHAQTIETLKRGLGKAHRHKTPSKPLPAAAAAAVQSIMMIGKKRKFRWKQEQGKLERVIKGVNLDCYRKLRSAGMSTSLVQSAFSIPSFAFFPCRPCFPARP